MAEAQGHAAQLGLPGRDDYQTRIDLVQWTAPEYQDPWQQVSEAQRIRRIIALWTHNVRDAVADLAKQGVEPTAPTMDPNPLTGVEAVVCFKDPDGHIVELIEYMDGVVGSKVEHLRKDKK